MKATSKVKILKLAIVLALAVWMLSPEVSLITGGDGVDFSIGHESEFEVGDTTADAISNNLSSCLDEGAVEVTYGGNRSDLAYADCDRIAETIKASGASSYRAIDADKGTVVLESVDMSTETSQITLVRLNTTQSFIDSISPSLTVGFALGDSDVMIPTDSRIESADGKMDIYIDLPVGLYDIARDLGCELFIGMDIHYMGLMDLSVAIGNDETNAEDARISVAEGVCTISFDASAEDVADQIEGLDGAAICGQPVTSSVTPSSATASFPVGSSATLSSFLSSCLSAQGRLSLVHGSLDIELAGDQAEGLIGIIGMLEDSA